MVSKGLLVTTVLGQVLTHQLPRWRARAPLPVLAVGANAGTAAGGSAAGGSAAVGASASLGADAAKIRAEALEVQTTC